LAERIKLASEYLMLQMHVMRLRFGSVMRVSVPLVARDMSTCIDCGGPILPSTHYQNARWHDHNTAGFHAHVTCPPPTSRWLADRDFTVVFDRHVTMPQSCASCHRRPAVARCLIVDERVRIRYVCDMCVSTSEVVV